MRTARWKIVTYSLVIILGLGAALPSFLPTSFSSAWPEWITANRITLGLDLRGGSHLVLEVDSRALIAERLQLLADDLRRALRDDGIRTVTVQARPDAIELGLADPAQRDIVIAKAREVAPVVGQGLFGAGQPGVDMQSTAERTLTLTLTDAFVRDRVNAAIEQSLEIVRHRIDEVGVAEPTIQQVGADRILVQLPGVQDPDRLKTLLGSTAKLSFHLVAQHFGVRSAGAKMLAMKDGTGELPVEPRPILTGDHLVDAAPARNPQTGEPIVSFRFDRAGARTFGEVTQTHVGAPLAIVLDDKVLSAPVIREPILGGSGQISGGFTFQEASDLAALLRAGALPAPLTVIEERTVGPDLGGDAIQMGLWTGLAGFALVFGFMMALYRGWGLIANLALALNVGLISH
jgi:SecD/SecF fusion protein